MGSTRRMSSADPEYNAQAAYYKNLRGQYEDSLSNYTGNAGYQNSVNQATYGANLASQGAARKASSMASTAGLTKSAAAARGAEAASQGYYNAFGQQQNAAYQSGLANVQGYNQAMQNQGNLMQMQQQQKDAEYNRAWGNVGNSLGIAGSFISAMSDANLKNYYKISENNYWMSKEEEVHSLVNNTHLYLNTDIQRENNTYLKQIYASDKQFESYANPNMMLYINSDKNMYYGAKGCAPSDKMAGGGMGGMGGMSGGTGNISAGNLMGGAGASGMGAGDASSGADFSSMGEAASAMA